MFKTAERVYKATETTVMTDDITKLEVEATANPANSRLAMGGGVAGAILRAGGTQIQNEVQGKICDTFAYDGTTRDVNEQRKLQISNHSRFGMRQTGVKNLALPGLGTGVGGLN